MKISILCVLFLFFFINYGNYKEFIDSKFRIFIAYSILIIIFISSTAYGAILTNDFFILRFFVLSYSIVLVANTYLALKIVLSLKQIKC